MNRAKTQGALVLAALALAALLGAAAASTDHCDANTTDPEGTYSGAGARACTRNGTDTGLSCAAGTYIDAANGTCVACAPGTFASEANATACAACAPGKYQDTEGATACSACAKGTYQGSAGATACTWCEPGTFQNVTGAAECTPCALGRFRNYSGAAEGCDPCFWGTYANATGSPDCTPCAPGTFAQDIASTVCTACAPGTFRDTERSEACLPCPPNTFYPAAGATACAPCPEGTYSGAGARACTRNGTDAGLSCAAGTYIDAANGTCVACAPGTFASEANATVCTNCPAGTNSSAGAVTCNEDGTISNGTNTTFSATFDVSASGYDAEGNTVTLVWSTVNACPDSTEYMAVVADAPDASNCSMAAMTGVAFGEQPSSPLWSYRRQGEWGAADCYSGELMFQASLEDALACFGAGVASATHTEYLAEVVVRTNAGRSFATTTGLRVPTTVRNYTGQVQYTPGSDKMVVPGVPHVRGTRLTYDASAGRVVIRVVTTTAWPYVFDSEAGYNPGTTGWTEAGNGSAPGWKDQQYFPFSLQPTDSFVTNDGCSASRGSEGMSCEQEWDLPIERVPGAAAASKACEAVGTYGLEFRHRCSRHNGGNFSCEDIGAGVNTTTATVALDADSLCVEVFQIGRTVEERDDASPASHAAPSMAAAAMLAAATAAWALLLA